MYADVLCQFCFNFLHAIDKTVHIVHLLMYSFANYADKMQREIAIESNLDHSMNKQKENAICLPPKLKSSDFNLHVVAVTRCFRSKSVNVGVFSHCFETLK